MATEKPTPSELRVLAMKTYELINTWPEMSEKDFDAEYEHNVAVIEAALVEARMGHVKDLESPQATAVGSAGNLRHGKAVTASVEEETGITDYPATTPARGPEEAGALHTSNPIPIIAGSGSDQDGAWARAWLHERGYSYDDADSLADLLALVRKAGREDEALDRAVEKLHAERERTAKENDG